MITTVKGEQKYILECTQIIKGYVAIQHNFFLHYQIISVHNIYYMSSVEIHVAISPNLKFTTFRSHQARKECNESLTYFS